MSREVCQELLTKLNSGKWRYRTVYLREEEPVVQWRYPDLGESEVDIDSCATRFSTWREVHCFLLGAYMASM
jgi:hypothetical protein